MIDSTHRAPVQDERDISALMNGWIHRDTGDWAGLRGLFHPDAQISITWFSGLAYDFVDASERMGASKLRTKHVIATPFITFSASGDRAVTETNAIVVAENSELELGATTHNRFIDRVERREGRWAIVNRESIYDFGSFNFPRGLPAAIDRDTVAKFPIEYAALAYLLEASGFPVRGTFPVKNSDQERSIKRDAANWLA